MFSSFIANSPTLSLAPAAGSFQFQTKYIYFSDNAPVILGLEGTDSATRHAERASPSNGWFSPKYVEAGGSIQTIAPLSLSLLHAEIWSENGRIYIRDLDSPFGTYVNDARVNGNPVTLKKGDTISLGHPIARNSNTPSYITDDHLKPIIARISLSGTS
ncbi:hypothetical protein HGRIS_000584 [Hohenbuehelia grisea]|uniref:FHA domain-containing protein n=1 Tax=Hohenbuehelia grisea TaxID=104357 RepID=A0ABR3JRM5_9AGAR